MSIRLWRVLLFVLIIIGSTILIYPFPRDMVPLYLKSGEIAKASDLIDQLLDEDPDDIELLGIGAEVYAYRGLPDKAIFCLNKVLSQQPDKANILEKLVQLYEWNVMPRKALNALERLSQVNPKGLKTLEKMVMYYRYFDMLPDEVAAIIKLNILQSKKLFNDFFLTELTNEVEKLARKYEAKPDDMLLAYLIRQIFVVGEQFRVALNYEDKINQLDYVTYIIEYYISMDSAQAAYEYAARMDAGKRGGFENRLRVATVLSWFRKYERALQIVAELGELAPENIEVAKQTAEIARAAGRYELAEAALEKLVELEPDNAKHQENLGQMYVENGKYDKAINTFRRLARKFNSWFKYAHDALRAALFSGDTKMMADVVTETEDVDISESEYLRTKADVLLALNRPLEAYPVLKGLALKPEATLYDYERLLDAAIASKDKEMVAETVALAFKFDSGNISLMRRSAQAWKEAGEPFKAYQLYLEVVARSADRQDVINLLLAASDTQDLKIARNAAGQAVSIFPEDVRVTAQAGEIMLWLNSPKDAYPYYKKAAELTGGNQDYVMTMIQTASYSGSKKIFRDAAETAMKLRPHDEQVAMLAAAVWAASGDSSRAAMLIDRFARGGTANIEMLLKWADFADKSGLSEEAYRIYDQLYALNYRTTSIRKKLSRLAAWTNRPAVAARFLGEMSDDRPRDFTLAMQAAKGFSDAGEYKRAVEYYERAAGLRPSDNDLKLTLSKAYAFADMNKQRMRLLNELYRAGALPENERIELARVFLDERKSEAALDILEPYSRLPKLPRFEGFLLVSALQQAGRGGEASGVYKRLGKEYAKDEVFLARLGAEALFNNFTTDAYGLFNAALKLNKDNHTALKGLAIILGERQQYRRAVAKFRHYNRLVPDDAEARYQLGEIYRFMGREADALREFKKASRIIGVKGGRDILRRKLKQVNRE